MLETYPIENWNGGKVRRISNSILQLMNGEIFNIHGKTFFTMGGAVSIDRHRRIEGKSWWKQEIPPKEDFLNGIQNLEKFHFKVDHIITHTLPHEILEQNFRMYKEYDNSLSSYLRFISNNVQFSSWHSGHMHQDIQFGNCYIHYLKIFELK